MLRPAPYMTATPATSHGMIFSGAQSNALCAFMSISYSSCTMRAAALATGCSASQERLSHAVDIICARSEALARAPVQFALKIEDQSAQRYQCL